MTFCLILALAVAAAAYLIPTQSDDSSAAGTGNYEISGMPGTYDDLASAFDAVNKDSGTSFIIIAHGDDADVTSFVLDSGKKVTLMSSDGNQFVLKISAGRHGTVNGDLTLENITLDGNKTAGGIEVNANASLTMKDGAVIQNCYTEFNGGGVYSEGTFIMKGGKISGNTAYMGGGVCNGYNSIFIMEGGEVSGNIVRLNGGGVRNNEHCTFTMTGGLISGNKSISSGGGVDNGDGSIFTMTGGEISNNTASYGGGVRSGYLSIFTMEGGKISGNTVDDSGAGVYNYYKGTFMMTGGEISNNNNKWYFGGGVFNEDGTFTMTGGLISGNTSYYGGGVFNGYGSTFTMKGGKISNNTAFSGGGGIWAVDFANLIIADGVVFTGNSAQTLRTGDISAAEDFDTNDISDLDDYANNIGSVVLDAKVYIGQNAPAYNNYDIGYPGDSYIVYVNINVVVGGTVTVTDSDDGTVYGVLTSDGWIYVPIAAVSITLSAASEEGYEFRQFIIGGTSENGDGPLIIPISGNMSIAAEFESTAIPPAEDEEYTIEATADNGSTVTPEGEVNVPAGSDITFAFSAKPGYLITAVYVDGVAISSEKLASGKYTFSDVVADHTIKVVTTIIGGGGSGGGGSNGGGNGGTNGNEGGSGDGDIGGNGGNEDGPGNSGVSESGGSAIGLICAMIAVLAGIAAVAVGVNRFRKR